jgi:hypothetical protein
VWARSSSIHASHWRTEVRKALPLDNVTRWNSWHALISSALKKRTEITHFISKHSELADDELSRADWEYLTAINDILEVFAKATLATEGDDVTLSQYLETFDTLLTFYETLSVSSHLYCISC